MEIPVTKEVEYLVNRSKDLQAQLKKAYETWMAVNGAIQENNQTLVALSKMMLEKDESKPEEAPEQNDVKEEI